MPYHSGSTFHVETMQDDKTPKSGPLERYISVLEAIAASPDDLSVRDLEIVLNLPKTTVGRLISALEASDLVQHGAQRGAYRMGKRLSRIMHSDTAWIEVMGKRLLKMLADATGETCFVARLYGASVRSIAMESPNAVIGVYVTPGSSLPSHVTATGKLLTAFQAPGFHEAIFQADPKIDRLRLKAEYERIRSDGYAIEDGEHVPGLFTLACPITVSADEAPIYALGVTGPKERIQAKIPDTILDKMRNTAGEMALLVRRN